ncbi:MAG: hypothetical protein SVU32_06860 [Candidatus Nanohaloarchaea archaeon]|nr:hypothetical protein [Candidatus Nanohaloarchaea archaeon]
MRDRLAPLSQALDSTTDRLTDTWLYSRFNDITGRLSSTFIGPHSYGPQESKDDLKEEIYHFKPPKNGYSKEDYLDEVTDILEGRKDRLEAQTSDPSLYRAIRMKVDEIAYIGGRGVQAAGGGSLVYAATISPSLLFSLWGYSAGSATVLGSPIGVKSAIEDIWEYRDPEIVGNDLEIYEEALDEFDEQGVEALPDDFSSWVRVPPLGRKKVSFTLNDDGYSRD